MNSIKNSFSFPSLISYRLSNEFKNYFLFSLMFLCVCLVFNIPSRVLCHSYRNLAAAQLQAGRSEEEQAFGIKKKSAALDIGE